MPHSPVQLLDIFTSALLAWAAAFRGGRHGLPITGGVLLGMICGLASPALRIVSTSMSSAATERMLPLFFSDPAYAAAGFFGACAGLALQRRGPEDASLFRTLEALSLGLATGLGTCAALAAFLPPVSCVIIGFAVGAAGGFIRDICLLERPAILEAEFYGGALVVGAMTVTALDALQAGFWRQIAASVAVVVALRLWGGRRGRLRGIISEF